jgi:hypothetical protein
MHRWSKALWRAAAGLAMAVGFLAPGLAHDRLGGNLNSIADYARNHEFTDLVRQSRRFLRVGQYDDLQPANLAPLGSDGWPTSDFRLIAMVAQERTANLAGTYQVVFNGRASVGIGGGGSGSITSISYDAGTNTTRVTVSFPAGGSNLFLDFTGTGGSVKNLRVLRPGADPANAPTFTAAWRGHVQRLPVLRFMDWTRTNGNREVHWSDRVTPERRRSEAYGARWETVIEAANTLGRDPWINIPVQASDDYVLQLATLLRDRLSPNLNVWVEYGNELWNYGLYDTTMDGLHGGTPFNGAAVNRDLAVASPAGSPLRFDGTTEPATLGYRRVALRLKQVADIFRGVWGPAAMNTRVRPVLAGQMANPYVVNEGLRLLETGLGVAPGNVIYAISGAPYIFPSATPDGGVDETPGLTVTQILDGMAAGVANAPRAYAYQAHAALAAWHGLRVVGYEGGFDTAGSQNIANKRLANLDPRIRGICRNLLDQWHAHGFELFAWFSLGAASYDTPYGMWPLVEDMAVPAVPKNQCIDDVLAAPLPPVTAGVPVLGGAVAGGNFIGSPSPAGSLTATASAFGWPGYVEYLLRADVAGTYSLVFTGQAPAGESFRLKLNNSLVSSGVTLPATLGASQPLAVPLRQGLNAMRIERATGGSWSVTSMRFGSPDQAMLSVSLSGPGSGSVSSTPAGILCGSGQTACTATFPKGTVVTLAAAPAATSSFSGWSGACSGSAPCAVSPGVATAVGAAFALLPQSVRLGAASFSAGEGARRVTIPVTRSSGAGTGTVVLSTVDGTALAGQDYVASNATVSFNAGVTTVNVAVSLVNNTLAEPDETFGVALSSPSGGLVLGSPSAATVTITDDGDRHVEFAATAVSVGESAGSVTLRVRRLGPAGAAASVRYTTGNITAGAGRDYVASSGTLSWAAGDAADKTITIAVRQDTLREGNETFKVTLTTPVDGVRLGTARTVTVTIVDDD